MNSVNNKADTQPALSPASDSSRGESSRIKELEGLFAGVGLLNELEPVSDLDPVPNVSGSTCVSSSGFNNLLAERSQRPDIGGVPKLAKPRMSSATDLLPLARLDRSDNCWRLSNGTQVKIFVGTVCEHVLR
jgi:hypothetical protein